jgi:hypothetical protein
MKPYRILFALAALYNFAFGIWAGLFPQSFFTLFRLAPPVYPSIWACLGMVVGVYALAYAYVAWKPQDGDVLVAIGLIGKVLGPLGWVWSVWQGELPPRTFPLILLNDLIWWFPFLFYLLRNKRHRSRIVIFTTVAVHSIACVGTLLTRGGTEIHPSLMERQRWILESSPLWATVWVAWVLSSLSILAFFTVWARQLKTRFSLKGAALWVALGLGALGVPFDLTGELINIVWLTDPSNSLERFTRGTELYLLFGAAIANGLYCLAGLQFSRLSWKTGFLKNGVGVLGFLMWGVGIALTVTTLLHHRPGIVATGAGVMALFIPWAAWAGWRFKDPPFKGKKA